MTEESINQMRIALQIAGFRVDNQGVDRVVSIYELVMSKGDQTTLRDITQVVVEVEQREKNRQNAEKS